MSMSTENDDEHWDQEKAAPIQIESRMNLLESIIGVREVGRIQCRMQSALYYSRRTRNAQRGRNDGHKALGHSTLTEQSSLSHAEPYRRHKFDKNMARSGKLMHHLDSNKLSPQQLTRTTSQIKSEHCQFYPVCLTYQLDLLSPFTVGDQGFHFFKFG